MSFVLPLLLLALFVLCFVKKVDGYSSFVEGAKEGLPLAFDLLPCLACMLIAVELAKASGLVNLLQGVLSPVFSLFGIPKELSQLVLLKPFSGSASLAMLNDLLTTYGTDSYVGRCASVVFGSSETVFYISTVYFSNTNVKKLGFGLACGVFCSFFACVLGCLLCRII